MLLDHVENVEAFVEDLHAKVYSLLLCVKLGRVLVNRELHVGLSLSLLLPMITRIIFDF